MEQYTVPNSGELVELPLSLHDHEFVGGIYLSKMCHDCVHILLTSLREKEKSICHIYMNTIL